MNPKAHSEELLEMFSEAINAASRRNNSLMKHIRKVSFALIFTFLGLAGIILAYLIYPGRPSKSRVLAFDGFIELPASGRLTILDYLTLDDKFLFVTSESSGALFKIALSSNDLRASTVSQTTGGGAAHGVAVVPGMSVAFVTRSEANTVDVFDPQSLQQLTRIPVADGADAILYIPSAKLIYVAHGDANMATLIDPEKRATVGTIQLPGKPEFPAWDSQTGLLFQNLEDINEVAAIDVVGRSVVGQWPLAPCKGPSGMAIDSEERRLFAVCRANAKLVVFDLEKHQVVTSLRTGSGPDSVAFDQGLHRLYIAGKAGEMTVIEQEGPDDYQVLDRIQTHYGAHTLTVDPVSHRVFVAYASLLVHPKIAVFSPTR
jgi:DNA-binding beta-propeller fold protein YncE